jgi:hypothetical protein
MPKKQAFAAENGGPLPPIGLDFALPSLPAMEAAQS